MRFLSYEAGGGGGGLMNKLFLRSVVPFPFFARINEVQLGLHVKMELSDSGVKN
jgi:hypothetical protein